MSATMKDMYQLLSHTLNELNKHKDIQNKLIRNWNLRMDIRHFRRESAKICLGPNSFSALDIYLFTTYLQAAKLNGVISDLPGYDFLCPQAKDFLTEGADKPEPATGFIKATVKYSDFEDLTIKFTPIIIDTSDAEIRVSADISRETNKVGFVDIRNYNFVVKDRITNEAIKECKTDIDVIKNSILKLLRNLFRVYNICIAYGMEEKYIGSTK